MATLSEIQAKGTPPASNGLSGWGYYLNGGQFDSADDSYAQDFLARLRKYDPSAHFERVESVLGNGGEGGGGGPAAYELRYDKTKLPGGDVPVGIDMNEGAYAGFRKDPGAGFGGTLFDNDAITTDPNGFGRITDPRNVNVAKDQHGALDTWGPIIMAAITMGAGALASGAMGAGAASSFGSGAAGANTVGAGLAQGTVNAARAAGNGGGAASFIPLAAQLGGSALGIDPSISSAVVNGGLAARRGDWTSAALAAASPLAGAAGVNPMLTSGATTFARILAAQQNSGRGGGR